MIQTEAKMWQRNEKKKKVNKTMMKHSLFIRGKSKNKVLVGNENKKNNNITVIFQQPFLITWL